MSELLPETIFKQLPLNLTIDFRLAGQDDLPKLEWEGQYTHFRKIFEYTYSEQLAGRRLMLLADFNDYPIGQIFILLHSRRARTKHGYFYSLRVMTPFRGVGLGTELIRQAENRLLEQHVYSATIAVAKDNTGALRLYERNGYRIYAEDEGRWSYTNHTGKHVQVHEPCWMLEKHLRS